MLTVYKNGDLNASCDRDAPHTCASVLVTRNHQRLKSLTMKDADVIIVGGGPAGLTLAQILHTSGVSCVVLERDAALASRDQGWAVALSG